MEALRIQTHCGEWGLFRGQEPTPFYIGSLGECISRRALEQRGISLEEAPTAQEAT